VAEKVIVQVVPALQSGVGFAETASAVIGYNVVATIKSPTNALLICFMPEV
jgi:hypothetical protein